MRNPTRAFSAVVAGTALSLVASGSALAALTAQVGAAGATSIAAAVAGPGTNVTGAGFTSTTGGTPNATGDSALSFFPTDGPTFGILSTGNALLADDANANDPDLGGPNSLPDPGERSVDNGGATPAGRGASAYDVQVLKVDVDVPVGANCLTLDFAFYSEEFQEYVNTQFNDAFIAELDTTTWTTMPDNSIQAPDNFAFGPDGKVISINTSGNTSMTAANAAGTTYDGATPLLSASSQITSGAHSVYLSIFDQGDRILDSAVFLDNVVVGFVEDPASNCVPGATPKQFQLVLAPPTASNNVGAQHTVTATLTDTVAGGAAVVGAPVLFDVAGANTTGGSGTTDAAGEADFSYTGTSLGSDTITACHDADGNGACGSGEASAAVGADWTNAPPIVTSVTVPVVPVPVGSAVSASATYTDDGDLALHTAQWAWDDSTTSAGTVSGNDVGPDGHVYAAPGIYTVCVTVTDSGGLSDSGCAADYVVVYDPSAGFVTGGGWIQSPAGAYTPADASDPDVVGRANFGFVSKYQKGQSTPTGKTEFQFQAGGLNFHSDLYDWLVVSGSKATYKGTGTVNGGGAYKFLLTAVDGGKTSTDSFRIKIWDAVSGTVLYDNQAGQGDGSSSATTISGGSIVIHA